MIFTASSLRNSCVLAVDMKLLVLFAAVSLACGQYLAPKTRQVQSHYYFDDQRLMTSLARQFPNFWNSISSGECCATRDLFT